MRSEKGSALIEASLSIALLGIIAVCFLGAITTGMKASFITDEKGTAQSLVRSEIEYVKNHAYDYFASEYPVDPSITIPDGWSIPTPSVGALHATDDGIQSVNVTAEHNGKTILLVEVYKINR